jgi:hypothetical protein
VSGSGIVCNGLAVAVAGSYTATRQTELPRGHRAIDLIAILREAIQTRIGH